MHILMVSLDYPPTVGGITAHVYELSQALLALGCQVSVATRKLPQVQADHEIIDGVNIYRLPLRFAGFIYGWQINRFVQRLVTRIKPDLVHVHGMRPLEFYAEKRLPLVYTNHTSGYLKRIKKGGYRIAQLKRLFAKPDLFLAPSEELLEIPFEIRANKRFISNGVISSKFNHDAQQRLAIRRRLGLAEDAVVAIVTRRMVWKNGVGYLAEATKYLCNEKLQLLFIGDGEEKVAVESLLQQHFAGRFFMLGSMRHEEIIPYYSAADLSILPSLMEATSISGLEAMAASLPLVGTRVGGIPVLIKDGENGYLCEPANPQDLAEKIDLLLAGDFRAMGRQSRRMVEQHFDWIEIARQTLDAYRLVLP